MLDQKNLAETMKKQLQVETKGAIERMSEYALKNPNFNR